MNLAAIELILVGITALLALWTMGHAMLHKPEPRAAAIWILICLAVPLLGAVLYLLFGINRRTSRARRRAATRLPDEQMTSPLGGATQTAEKVTVPAELEHYRALVLTTGQVTGLPLLAGNRLEPLFNGDAAYPRMLQAIASARRWIYLSSYIFDGRDAGQQFVDALHQAHLRGVEVRVVIDGIGEWYDGGRTRRQLRRAGIGAVVFLPPQLLPPQLAVNLRNHRKLLLIDGRLGFVGGMNIRTQNQNWRGQPRSIADLAVQITGPVLEQMIEVAVSDWRYVTGDQWQPPSLPVETSAEPPAPFVSTALCRVIPDGPAQQEDKLLAVLLGAVATAREAVWLMTPYFLPPRELAALLLAAVRRGVAVTIVLPQKSDHPIVQWASLHALPELLVGGVRVYRQPPPFAHTKLVVVDDYYSQFGSANIDARSLHLNFELMVESYDQHFCEQMVRHCQTVIEQSEPLNAQMLLSRPLWVRLRNAFFWLFSPNL